MKIPYISTILAERKRRVRLLESISSIATMLANRTMRRLGKTISVLVEPGHTHWMKSVCLKGTGGELMIGQDHIIYRKVDDQEGEYYVRARLKDLSTAELQGLNKTLKQQLHGAKKSSGLRLDHTA